MFNSQTDSYNQLIKALDLIPESILFCDAQGALLYSNKYFSSTFGKVKDYFINELQRAMKERKSLTGEDCKIEIAGKTIKLINSVYPIFNEDGTLFGAIGFLRNYADVMKITERFFGSYAPYTFKDILGENNNFKMAVNLAASYTATSENILILGEKGTGKKLIAQCIHNESERKANPFVMINCGDSTSDMIETDLFGAFQPGSNDEVSINKGRKLEYTKGGTVFLEAIDGLPFHLQERLLKLIEDSPKKTAVRIIGAADESLEKLAETGGFRKDLYYLLRTHCVKLPPLKNRGKDILLLAGHFINNLALQMNKQADSFTEEAEEMLMKYDWPGNVKELEIILSRCVYISSGRYVDQETLIKAGFKENTPKEAARSKPFVIYWETLEEALRSTGGNKKKAAEMLGISRPTLYKLLREYKEGKRSPPG